MRQINVIVHFRVFCCILRYGKKLEPIKGIKDSRKKVIIMQQCFVGGNQFQNQMWIKFGIDVGSASANMLYVREKDDLIYEYIIDIASLFPAPRYGLGNPMGLYSDYDSFKKHFARYWKNALDLSRGDMDKIRDIFDGEISSQESCKNRAVLSVYFENGQALTVEDCLSAIYEVLKMYQ